MLYILANSTYLVLIEEMVCESRNVLQLVDVGSQFRLFSNTLVASVSMVSSLVGNFNSVPSGGGIACEVGCK